MKQIQVDHSIAGAENVHNRVCTHTLLLVDLCYIHWAGFCLATLGGGGG